MVRDIDLFLNLWVMGWLFFPVLAPPLLRHPPPYWRHTPGSAGPARRSSLPGLSCCLYCNQSPLGRRAHHPVLKWCCCCCCCICHEFPERKGGGGKIQRGREIERERWRETRGKRKEKLLKGRNVYNWLEKEGKSYLLWALISRAPAPLSIACTVLCICSHPLPWDGRRKSYKIYGFPSSFASRVCISKSNQKISNHKTWAASYI